MPKGNHRVEVDGVGSFLFRHRTLKLQIAIEAGMERVTLGPVQGAGLRLFAAAIATLETLTVEGPDGWDLDEIDPLDDEEFAKVEKVFGRLRDVEETFRKERAGLRSNGRAAA